MESTMRSHLNSGMGRSSSYGCCSWWTWWQWNIGYVAYEDDVVRDYYVDKAKDEGRVIEGVIEDYDLLHEYSSESFYVKIL